MRLKSKFLIIASVALVQGCSAGQSLDLQELLTRPSMIERSAEVSTVQLEIRMDKLFLPASINGQTKEFIFDTGSPTILTREFADTLGLEIVGQNTGRDANGREVTMDVAIVETLALGDVEFRQVPVLIFDYSKLDMGPCIFDGGVIGSEILPGSVWRIDTENARLDIAASRESLPPTSLSTPLRDFGYPHAPVVSYSVGKVQDNAIFDTGTADQIVLYKRVADMDSVQRSILPGSVARGRGSDGVSAGGIGRDRQLVRFTLSDFLLGEQDVGPLRATTRDTTPSLIGAGLLDRYIVTLDYNSGELLLQDRQHPAIANRDAGYAISIINRTATVTQIFNSSAAAQAGLLLGDRVTSINGNKMTEKSGSSGCKVASWLTNTFDRTAAAEIIVDRNGQSQMIRIPALD